MLASPFPVQRRTCVSFRRIKTVRFSVMCHWSCQRGLEACADLGNAEKTWDVLFTNAPPTTIANRLWHDSKTNRTVFCRIHAER